MAQPVRGEIWRAKLPKGMGHEQEGVRPAVIIVDVGQSDIIMALPLTGEPDAERFKYTFEVVPNDRNNLGKESIALVFQMRALSKERLVEKVGELDAKDLAHINLILKDMLKLA